MAADENRSTVDRLIDKLRIALATGTKESFTALLTEDVRWGSAHECTTREQAGNHYATLLADGIRLRITDVEETATPEPERRIMLRIDVNTSEPNDSPPAMRVRLTIRENLISDICILDEPTTAEVHQAAASAVHDGDPETLQQLLAGHPDLAAMRLPGRGSRTLLHIATDWPGHFPRVAESIALLIASGADPDSPFLGAHSETPLHWAASCDDVAAIDALLDAGADIEARGGVIGGGTPISDATAFGQWNAARRLLERGATTTLFDASCLGQVDAVEHALASEHPTPEDITSSFWGACHGGQIGTASVLLDHGAGINWIGYDGLSPLDAARRSEADDVVRWLERIAASTDPVDPDS
ncbi:ankyrin repeat domain-containing protein [Rhodococcoides yunnanense]|uniref:ankyrin repeat domain-containing protein n=1 Tax=Rhodococcoides yunnanense TaxID=278209 RepID=UPI001C3FC56B|nr:ankyrin repeat domain-containing protein [Rhodococcus yunnanensis]